MGQHVWHCGDIPLYHMWLLNYMETVVLWIFVKKERKLIQNKALLFLTWVLLAIVMAFGVSISEIPKIDTRRKTSSKP